MLSVALKENMKTKPDVFGEREVVLLPGERKPLPCHPPIVGNTLYKPGDNKITLGQTFLHHKLKNHRNMINNPNPKLEMPNTNSPMTY
jgi:hypothetical protein